MVYTGVLPVVCQQSIFNQLTGAGRLADPRKLVENRVLANCGQQGRTNRQRPIEVGKAAENEILCNLAT